MYKRQDKDYLKEEGKEAIKKFCLFMLNLIESITHAASFLIYLFIFLCKWVILLIEAFYKEASAKIKSIRG